MKIINCIVKYFRQKKSDRICRCRKLTDKQIILICDNAMGEYEFINSDVLREYRHRLITRRQY